MPQLSETMTGTDYIHVCCGKCKKLIGVMVPFGNINVFCRNCHIDSLIQKMNTQLGYKMKNGYKN